MKKVLAALAVLAISSIGFTAFAAENDAPTVKGNIEIYGAAKVSVDFITTDAKAPGAGGSLTKVSSNSSRLGFKSKEDLSDDLSTIMQLELGVAYDGDTASPTYRNSYLGLSSKAFGAVIVGINDTPYKLSTGSLDAFGDTMGDYNAIMGNVNGAADFDLRAKDTIMYTSPKLAGIQIMAQSSEAKTETDISPKPTPTERSFSATYGNGPLYVVFAHEAQKNGYGSLDLPTHQIRANRVGAGYTLGGTKIGLVYETLKDGNSNSKNTRNAAYLSLQQKLGKETIKLAYGKADDGEDPTTETGAKLTVLGVDHNFSKRTTAYLLYAKTDNEDDATYGLGQGGAGGAYKPKAGESPSVISVGMNHSF